MTDERKVLKHEVKLSVSDIFLSVSKYFQLSKFKQTSAKSIVYFF